jgi:2-polyprenyl-6-methoxyphenol hydroxylase-like FAD-dependent oxidoreductase
MKVLISGAGIAGTTLAYWLMHHGFEPTIVEAAPKPRTGGYIIDFWGAGFDIADRMGLVPEIMARGYRVREVKVVNNMGRRIAGIPVEAFAQIAQGRYISLARGDLAASIFKTIEEDVEVIFDDSVDCLEQTEPCLRVRFKRSGVRDFDLIVGADGLHSRIRKLVFGPQSGFEKYLGYKVAAFEVVGYTPRDELAYVMYTSVRQQVGRFSMRDNRTMFHFIFADENPELPDDLRQQKELLRKNFENSGWECRRILDALDSLDSLYLDRVSQIRMNPRQGLWSRGRVTLVGDAAFCVSLLGGQGSALAMVAAYILAGEIRRADGDCASAFARYQDLFGPFALQKQDAALRFAGAFAPKSKFALFLRNQIFNMLSVRWIANLAMGRDFADRITLPDYN